MAVSTKEVRLADYREMRLQNSHCLPASLAKQAYAEDLKPSPERGTSAILVAGTNSEDV